VKYTFIGVTGDRVTVIASNEKEARKEAMIEIWDVKRQSHNNCIPSKEGRGLYLENVS